MVIAISWRNQIYDEVYNYTKKCMVRHTSQASKKNIMLQIKIGGICEDEAWNTLTQLVKRLGYDPQKDCLSCKPYGEPASYDIDNNSLTESICVAKDFNALAQQKTELMSKARKIAKQLKREYIGIPSVLMIDTDKMEEFSYEVDA